MATYTITYDDEGPIANRDAWSLRVIVWRDGLRLGKWAGVVDGLLLANLPSSADERSALHRGATGATAARIRTMAERSELRDTWEIDVEFVALTHDDLETYASNRDHPWRPGETILQFTT